MEYLSKNFINLHELKKAELIEILSSAEQLKADRNSERNLLDGKSFILLFDNSYISLFLCRYIHKLSQSMIFADFIITALQLLNT